MNIRDIARLANVTPGTVSKVLNNYPDISENTRQHVLKIMKENQYTPSNSARLLKLSSKIPQIGLVVEGVYNWVNEMMLEILDIRLHNADYTVLSFHDNYFAQDKTEKFQELLAYIDRHNLTGMVYFGGNFKDVPAEHFQSLSCPVIFINTVLPDQTVAETYSSVQVNHYETARRQMEYLVEKGHQNICTLISSERDNSVYEIRRNAYQDVLRLHHLESSLTCFAESDYNCARAYQELTACLEKHPEITAVCSAADIMSPAAIRAIHDIGKIPGKDISIISFDGMDSLMYCVPSITTFEQPRQEMMDYVYDLLLGLISGKRQHLHITFQAKLIEGESCEKCNRP